MYTGVEIIPLMNYVCSSLYQKTNIHMVIRFSPNMENEVATAAERHLRANPPSRFPRRRPSILCGTDSVEDDMYVCRYVFIQAGKKSIELCL